MKIIIQRVLKASVTVGEEIISSIGRGHCILIGIARDDSPRYIEYMARKVLNMRLFENDDGKSWDKSVMDKNYEVLCVSQFTLCGILKGNKPDFHSAMDSEDSEKFYQMFLKQMRDYYRPEMIKEGKFGADMQVNIVNDGPVTIDLDSPPLENLPVVKERKPQRPPKSKTNQTSQEKQDAISKENCSQLDSATASLDKTHLKDST